MVEADAGLAVLPAFATSAASRYRVTLQALRSPVTKVDFYEITRAGRGDSELLAELSHCIAEVLGAAAT